MNNYKWIAFLEALKLYLAALLQAQAISGQQAAHVIGITIENTDDVSWQVRSYQVPVSQMMGEYVQFQLGNSAAPTWWKNSPTVPES